ncbi:MAG: BREX-1 system adenine-specific DNA-methyltransferase PglX [Candidatus Nanopelagicales bacterium]
MDTAPLKSFATWARTALIREVTARIAVVLAPASPQRVEQPRTVAALEEAITAAGGADKGRGAVADRVAYTWFNRIIALRFMDANGYTGIGVVSPQSGVEVGQPEVLAEAKRANIDPEVVDQKIRETVTELLNGTRHSHDPQGEAYALLLAEYCRHWNRAMPFMFERQGDFTELLMPANLLAYDSVLNRAVNALTEPVCQDVEVIGWLYQFYISERKDEVFAGFKKSKKAGAEEIPAATQLFTPHWIVRFLVENSLGRLWMLNRPNSRLVDHMDYYIAPSDTKSEFLKVVGPEELRVIDPACGSGHLLTYAFDLLYAIYEEEGYTPAEIPGLILANNLHGIEIDPRAGALAAFALSMKARSRQRTYFSKQVKPNVLVLTPISFSPDELDVLATQAGDRWEEGEFWNQFRQANLFGSLVRPDQELIARLARHLAEGVEDRGDLFAQNVIERAKRVVAQAVALSPTYAVAIANPPYMGAKNMDSRIAELAENAFADSKSDLFAMFIERCLDLVVLNGLVAMITMQTWMFISSFEKLRIRLLREAGLQTMAHLGTGAFDTIGGEVVSTTAFVLARGGGQNDPGVYVRLVSERGEAGKSAAFRRAIASGPTSDSLFIRSQNVFMRASVPGKPIAYWLPPQFFEAFEMPTRIGSAAKKGLSCSSTDRFYRFVWEVSRRKIADSRNTWVPITKGGPIRKWYGNNDHLLFWQDSGREIRSRKDASGKPSAAIRNESCYFEAGASWNDVSMTGIMSARYTPPGFIPTDSGPIIYDKGSRLLEILGFLNSTAVRPFTDLLCPTIHFGVGQVALFPLPGDEDETRDRRVERLLEIARADWDESETSSGFSRPAVFEYRDASKSLAEAFSMTFAGWQDRTDEALRAESENDEYFLARYRLNDLGIASVESKDITLFCNPDNRYNRLSAQERPGQMLKDTVQELISYAVGCIFGRFSLDLPGLILGDQGDSIQQYLDKISVPSFMPDSDNVIPIVDGDWFEDDIVTRFRQFLRVAFGEKYFEENLRFVTDALEVKDLRDYFVKSFYKDHVQRYKKRPIYWLFSSPKGSFNALIYMHRYTPSTASTVLNEYLREFKAKLEATLGQQERLATGGGTPRQQAVAQKEADRIRKMLLELNEYEHEVLYPLASQQIEIDLDDGVKVNYPKFGAALKKIPGLEAGE